MRRDADARGRTTGAWSLTLRRLRPLRGCAAVPRLPRRHLPVRRGAATRVLDAAARRGRRWIVVLAVALVTTVVTYFVFERYLLVLLPRGRWTGF